MFSLCKDLYICVRVFVFSFCHSKGTVYTDVMKKGNLWLYILWTQCASFTVLLGHDCVLILCLKPLKGSWRCTVTNFCKWNLVYLYICSYIYIPENSIAECYTVWYLNEQQIDGNIKVTKMFLDSPSSKGKSVSRFLKWLSDPWIYNST